MNRGTEHIETPADRLATAAQSGGASGRSVGARREARGTGQLIINADDWGRDRQTTQQTLDCVRLGTVSSVSAMVFMEDSERAAELAVKQGVDAGLHLNLTTPFSAKSCPAGLRERQGELVRYLCRSPFARLVFHPGLVRSFEYVVAAQCDEFVRLFGRKPERLDGHHHIHLCANVLFAKLLPAGTIARRNFTFQRGEKSLVNRLYRQGIDRLVARRHRIVDFLVSLPPLQPSGRLERIFSLSRNSVVEVETHPINPDEYRFLTSGEIRRFTGDIPIAPRFTLAPSRCEPVGKP